MTLDLILERGTVVDGTGKPPERTDVGIAADRIVEVGDLSKASALKRLDVSGRVVVPGFVAQAVAVAA